MHKRQKIKEKRVVEKYLCRIIEKIRSDLKEMVGEEYNFDNPSVQEKSRKLDRAINLLMKLRSRKYPDK